MRRVELSPVALAVSNTGSHFLTFLICLPLLLLTLGLYGEGADLGCRPGMAGYHDPPLKLPRLEVLGFDGLEEFVGKAELGIPRKDG